MNTRAAIAAEAAKHGYTLDSADLRVGRFFLKRGPEVRSLGCVGRITPDRARHYVEMTVTYGRRIDLIEGSRYFQGVKP